VYVLIIYFLQAKLSKKQIQQTNHRWECVEIR